MEKNKKRMKKLITYGVLIIIPVVLLLSFWFSSMGMGDGLSIFLIVLLSGGVLFGYHQAFCYFEERKKERDKNKPDPFAD